MNWKQKKLNIKPNKNYPEIISKLLALRGLSLDDEIENFLNPSLDKLPDPFDLPNIKRVIERILLAKKNGEKVFIYGDYDADGVTASSILWGFLYRELGLDTAVYIPSRFEEGYGLNNQAIEDIVSRSADLIITVDCGIKDQELIEKYKEKIDFIVTDHHTPPGRQDFGYLVLHPGIDKSDYQFKELAGAGVAWKLTQAISKYVKQEEGVLLDSNKYLDLAAIGTVCDVMPLVGENRIIVYHGLKRLDESENIGLGVLKKIAGVKSPVDTYDIGFKIGPRINAAGRLGKALDAVKLFSTNHPQAAESLARRLDNLNLERQKITFDMLEQAERKIPGDLDKLLFVYGDDWHEGVIGLVAGRLAQKYHRPAICATVIDGQVTASARSIESFNITSSLTDVAGYLTRFGGHAQAAGFSLEIDQLDSLQEALITKANEAINDLDLEPEINYDLELSLVDVNLEMIRQIEQLAPFGEANSKPIFLFKSLKILDKFTMGSESQHVKFIVSDGKGSIEALAFGRAEALEKFEKADTIDLLGSLNVNSWNGRDVPQIIISDVRSS